MGNRSGDMEAPRDFDALKRRLVEIEPGLPKRLKQTAAYALRHPDEIAFGTAASVAARAQVQASTLVRFAQALGFAGFSQLQGLFRAHLRDRWPDYQERLHTLPAHAPGDPSSLLEGFADAAARSVAALRSGLDRAALAGAVERLAKARLVFVVAQRRSFGVAHYLVYAFGQLGVAAVLADDVGGLGAEQVGALSPEDVLLAVSFAPYSPKTLGFVESARAHGACVIAITDSALSPLAGMADVRLDVSESDFGAFRSLAATHCLATTLAVAVAEKRGGLSGS